MKRKIVLGINEEHDAGCALVIDGQVTAAYSEERFSRIKMHNGQSDGLPHRSLKALLKDYDIKPLDIGYVSCGFPKGFYLMKQVYTELLKTRCWRWIFAGFLSRDFYGPGQYLYPYFDVLRKRSRLKRLLKSVGIKINKLVYMDHHIAHAASSYYTSGLDKALILTLDGRGSGLSGSISVGDGPRVFRKAAVSQYDSVGLLYSIITGGLGFKPMRHEGKILGLAAFGNADIYYEKFKEMIECNGLDFNFKLMRKYACPIYPNAISPKRSFEDAFKSWYKGDRENLCAALQKRVEEVVVEWAKNAIAKFGINDLVVAGGVFANVKINQRLQQLPEVKSLFVFPAMNDSGLPVGSALKTYYDKAMPEKRITEFPHTYLGKDFKEDDIKNELTRLDIKYRRIENIEEEIARLLNDGKVVAWYNGRAEYGPRALGNRSILYNGRDKTVNTWLNKKLDRTEFMPFAPSTLFEDAGLYYKDSESKNPSVLSAPASFMTITFECTGKMKKECPAAVHVDNTARPQFVHQEINPRYHKIISEYKKLCGSSTVVNTSFNAHEEPIVNSPKDALRSFLVTRLDALAMGNYLVLREDLAK